MIDLTVRILKLFMLILVGCLEVAVEGEDDTGDLLPLRMAEAAAVQNHKALPTWVDQHGRGIVAPGGLPPASSVNDATGRRHDHRDGVNNLQRRG